MDFINGLDEYNEDVIKISESPYEYNDTDDKDDCKCEKCYDHDNYCENGKCSCKDCKDECCEECEDDDERIEGFDYGELLDIFVGRIQDTGGDFYEIREILDEFADIFIPDYVDDEDYNFEDVIDDECECQDCNECVDCENKRECMENSVIEEIADMIENSDMCSNCLRSTLYELFVLGKKIGWSDCEKELDDEDVIKDENNKVNNVTYNLNINLDSMNGDELFKQINDGLKKMSRNI